MLRGATVGGTMWWVAAAAGAAALVAVFGFDGQGVVDGVSGAFHVSEMLLPPIEPWGAGPGAVV